MPLFVKGSLLSVVVGAGLLLGGCNANQTGIRGKVIEGNLGFIGEVDRDDPRLKDQGLAGVKLISRSAEGPSAQAIVGQATSDKKGEFLLPMRDPKASLYPLQFTASKEGYGDVRQTMPTPAGDRRLLIIMRPRDSAPGGR